MTIHLPETTYHVDLPSPLYRHKGELTGRLIILRDRTSGKQTEEALRKTNRDLQYKLTEIENCRIN